MHHIYRLQTAWVKNYLNYVAIQLTGLLAEYITIIVSPELCGKAQSVKWLYSIQ